MCSSRKPRQRLTPQSARTLSTALQPRATPPATGVCTHRPPPASPDSHQTPAGTAKAARESARRPAARPSARRSASRGARPRTTRATGTLNTSRPLVHSSQITHHRSQITEHEPSFIQDCFESDSTSSGKASHIATHARILSAVPPPNATDFISQPALDAGASRGIPTTATGTSRSRRTCTGRSLGTPSWTAAAAPRCAASWPPTPAAMSRSAIARSVELHALNTDKRCGAFRLGASSQPKDVPASHRSACSSIESAAWHTCSASIAWYKHGCTGIQRVIAQRLANHSGSSRACRSMCCFDPCQPCTCRMLHATTRTTQYVLIGRA